MSPITEFDIVPAGNEHHPFILDSFGRSFCKSPYADGLRPGEVRELVKPYLASWTILVAVEKEDHDSYCGWICFKNERNVAYAYVKPWWRTRGIFNSLLAEAKVVSGKVCTSFLCPESVGILRRRDIRLVFRPWMTL